MDGIGAFASGSNRADLLAYLNFNVENGERP